MPSLELENKELSLIELQAQFWSSTRNQTGEIYPLIGSDLSFLPKQRMDVYRTTARSAHVSALMDSYPVCRAILGDNYFKQIAKLYFVQTPSRSADMNEYGDSFPGFIAQLYNQREELRDYYYLIDLARLEWEYQKIYFSTDAVTFDVEIFQRDCERLGGNAVLALQPCISLMSSSFQIFEIWDMHRSDNVQTWINATRNRQHVCIYKKDYVVVVDKIDLDVYALLVSVRLSKSLSEIAELFDGRYDLNNALSTAMEKQWLAN